MANPHGSEARGVEAAVLWPRCARRWVVGAQNAACRVHAQDFCHEGRLLELGQALRRRPVENASGGGLGLARFQCSGSQLTDHDGKIRAVRGVSLRPCVTGQRLLWYVRGNQRRGKLRDCRLR